MIKRLPRLTILLLVVTLSMAFETGGAFAQALDLDEEPIIRGAGANEPEANLLDSFDRAPRFRAVLPDYVDLSDRMPPVGDQMDSGSCVSWATGHAVRGYYLRASRNFGQDAPLVSPLFLHTLLNACPDIGSNVPSAMRLMSQIGVVTEDQFPFSDQHCNRPSSTLIARASTLRIRGAKLLDHRQPDDLKGALAKGHPIAFGYLITAELGLLKGKNAGKIYDPSASQPNRGGHAMVITGYDERRQAFRVMNSWGKGWGQDGFGWFSYRSMAERARGAMIMEGFDPPPASPSPSTPPPAPIPSGPVSARALSDVAKSIACARVNVTERDGGLVLSGFVGETADQGRLLQLATQGGRRVDAARLAVRPWPQCEAMITLADALDAPRELAATIDFGNGRPPAAPGEVVRMTDGQPFSISITGPSQPAHLTVWYVQATGSVVPLWPRAGTANAPAAARERVTLGGGGDKARFRVSAPFGRETVIVIATDKPLIREALPAAMIERDFLTILRKSLLSGDPPKMVAAAVIPLETVAK